MATALSHQRCAICHQTFNRLAWTSTVAIGILLIFAACAPLRRGNPGCFSWHGRAWGRCYPFERRQTINQHGTYSITNCVGCFRTTPLLSDILFNFRTAKQTEDTLMNTRSNPDIEISIVKLIASQQLLCRTAHPDNPVQTSAPVPIKVFGKELVQCGCLSD